MGVKLRKGNGQNMLRQRNTKGVERRGGDGKVGGDMVGARGGQN